MASREEVVTISFDLETIVCGVCILSCFTSSGKFLWEMRLTRNLKGLYLKQGNPSVISSL